MLLRLLPNSNQPILIKEGQRLSRKQLVFILNHLTLNQNELIVNQNRIAVQLKNLMGLFKGFISDKAIIEKSTDANKTSSVKKTEKSPKNVTELSFSEEMEMMNKEMQDFFKIVPKFG